MQPVGYSKEQLARCEGASIPDLIGDGCRLLFVGINPGLQTAMTGIHFAHPSNRFWPALNRAGIIDWVPNVSPIAPAVPLPAPDSSHHGGSRAVGQARRGHAYRLYPVMRGSGLVGSMFDPDAGMSDAQRADFLSSGLGITNLVERATVRASELGREELLRGGERLLAVVRRIRPRLVAVAGVTAYRDAFGDSRAGLGEQSASIGDSALWVVPNPSGLNAHETIDSLASWYRAVADAAGVM